jgi:RNA recognition motif-containing protein
LGKKLYVGNLSYNTTSNDLERILGAYGTVKSAQIINDRDSGRSKGFGFVEMNSDDEAQAAIAGLNGKTIDGRNLTVSEARHQENRGSGFMRRGDNGARGGGGYRGGGNRGGFQGNH